MIDRFIDLKEIIEGDLEADPPQPALIPCGRTAWYAYVKQGRVPAPTKLGRRSFWRLSQIEALIARGPIRP